MFIVSFPDPQYSSGNETVRMRQYVSDDVMSLNVPPPLPHILTPITPSHLSHPHLSHPHHTHTHTHRLHLHLWPPGAAANSGWTVVWNLRHTHCHSHVSPPYDKKLVLLHPLTCGGEHQWFYSSVQSLPKDTREGVCCPHLCHPVSQRSSRTLTSAVVSVFSPSTHACTRTHAHVQWN